MPKQSEGRPEGLNVKEKSLGNLEHNCGEDADAAFSRRKIITVAGMGLGSLLVDSKSAEGSTVPANTLHQELDFNASASKLYNALLDEKQFASFTGAPAQIEPQVGGAFRLFYDHPPLKGISGINIELASNLRIVQAWRVEGWDAGIYSLVRFQLVAMPNVTHVVFDQVGLSEIPPATAWSKMYWDPLRKYLAS